MCSRRIRAGRYHRAISSAIAWTRHSPRSPRNRSASRFIHFVAFALRTPRSVSSGRYSALLDWSCGQTCDRSLLENEAAYRQAEGLGREDGCGIFVSCAHLQAPRLVSLIALRPQSLRAIGLDVFHGDENEILVSCPLENPSLRGASRARSGFR